MGGPSRSLLYFLSSSLHHKYTQYFTLVQKWLMKSTYPESSALDISYMLPFFFFFCLFFPSDGLEHELSPGQGHVIEQ